MSARKKNLHRWNLGYAEAVAVQEQVCEMVELRPLSLRRIRTVAGSDLAVSKTLDRLVAAVVVMTFPGLEVVETQTVSTPLVFPYIPGLLSFREIPALIECLERVRTPFDVMLCDAHGMAHPRGLGLASHLGVLIDKPTIGCAKSRLIGEHDDPGISRGDYAALMHKGKRIGSVVRTRDRINPLFISPGHLTDHPSARRITLACLTRYRLPEPTRLAHIAAGKAKRELEASRS